MNQSPQKPTDASLRVDALTEFTRQVRLIWRLYFDPRVPLWIKLIPTAAVAYVIWPIDVVPALAVPFVGALDDLGILAVGFATFINLCPPDIVAEHMQAIMGESGWRVVPPERPTEITPKVIDAPYSVKTEDDQQTH